MKTKWFNKLTITGGAYFSINYLRLTTAFLLFLFAIAAASSCGGGGGGDGGGGGGTSTPTLASIAVTPANYSIARGATQQFTATGTYSDSSTQNITSSVTWSSLDTSIAAINNAGLATASSNKSGPTTITATSGSILGSTQLMVAINLAKTGQTACYDAAGNVLPSCAGTGQDGELQKGVAASSRFTDNGNGTITDNLTGLMWTKDANAPGPNSCTPTAGRSWVEAVIYAACLNANSYLGYTDWRLPNIKELRSLIDHSRINPPLPSGHPFSNVQGAAYWSSTTNPASSGVWAYVINMTYSGSVVGTEYKSTTWSVWPVRAGDGGAPADLPKTGQTTCYNEVGGVIDCAGTGEDGDLKRGVAWPSARFTVDGTGDCVTDNLTNLMWVKNADLPNQGTLTWSQALDYANSITLCGYSDWRLPNIIELESLVDAEQTGPALPSGNPFSNVRLGYGILYWSSTTYINIYNPTVFDNAWFISMDDSATGATFKGASSASRYVWPVRGGQ